MTRCSSSQPAAPAPGRTALAPAEEIKGEGEKQRPTALHRTHLQGAGAVFTMLKFSTTHCSSHNERKVTCKHPVSGLPSQDNCIFVVNEHLNCGKLVHPVLNR
ncbi:hypothetical protein AGOR_G00184860 [Albula goreensis]|uniref:Uncharacterized protein n=1 Tax=Albula goreensis TaxID=1534307 RepID=A0A8T3CXF7_9TELE|nr:hypothetical protein AGOR_G00184860 [Albula goreensis]